MKPVTIAWPPSYRIRHSRRASRLSLKITVGKGLEVVLPQGVDSQKVLPFLQQQRQWIEKHLPAALYNPTQQCGESRPDSIHLPAVDETWAIDYVASPQRWRLIKQPHQELVVMGDIEETVAVKKQLIHWLRNRAKDYFHDYLTQLSDDIQLPYRRLSIRGQATRWGSCSADHAISLNYKLLFLPPEIVRYISVHELCHTVHLNHSSQFWRLVEIFVPNHRQLRQQLKQGQSSYLPWWLE